MSPDDASARPPPPIFSALAVELKLEIFAHIRYKVDQGNVRLVNQEWSLLMRPQMWRDWTSQLLHSIAKHLDSPGVKQSECFHDIRSLTVGSKFAISPKYSARLSSLMLLLRDDQLLEFNSPQYTPLNLSQFVSLLRRQTNLRSFRARMNFSDDVLAIPNVEAWMKEQEPLFTSALRSLTSLRVHVAQADTYGAFPEYSKAQQDFDRAFNRLLMRSAPRLDRLELWGWRKIPSGELHIHKRYERIDWAKFFGITADLSPAPRTLSHLYLHDFDLRPVDSAITKAVDFSALRSLKLEACHKIGHFLSTIAPSVRQTGTCLKVLSIRTARTISYIDGILVKEGLEEFLSSCSGLEELELYLPSECSGLNLVDQPKVKRLLLSLDGMFDRGPYSLSMIRHVLQQCPNIQIFSYPNGGVDPEDFMDCKPSCSLPHRLCSYLDVIARFPTIHTFQLMYLQTQDSETWREEAAQRYATQVLAHLHSKGSNITKLALFRYPFSFRFRFRRFGDNNMWNRFPRALDASTAEHSYYDLRSRHRLHYPLFNMGPFLPELRVSFRLQILDISGKRVVRAVPLHCGL